MKNWDEYNDIVIFGTGQTARTGYSEVYASKKNIIFCDNDKSKIGHRFMDSTPNSGTILSVSETVALYPHAFWFVASVVYMFEMRDQLNALGVPNERISLFDPAKAKPQKYLGFFTVFITEHCNMACKGCSAMSPLIKSPRFLDIDNYCSDMKRLSELFEDGKYIGRVDIMGGEPLLHPLVNEFVNTTRRYLPHSKIQIVTNGTLLTKMTDEFWETLSKSKTGVYISPYPITLNMKKIQQKAEEFDVSLTANPIGNEQKTSYHIALDEYGGHNPRHSFESCFQANSCFMLKHGKLYTCITMPYINTLNEYFGTKFNDTDFGIDIYKVKNREEVMQFLATPTPLCAYCDVDNRTSFTWELSHKKPEEWAIRLKN